MTPAHQEGLTATFRRTVTVGLALLVVAAPLSADDEPPEGPLPQRREPAGKPPAGDQRDVYVRDSFEAEDWLAKAGREAERGQWTAAVGFMRRVIDSHRDKLTRTGPEQYEPLCRAVQRQIAAWPAAGLQAYRSATEAEAARRLERARDAHRLDQALDVVERYFCTPAGAAAVTAAAEMGLERGEFALAIRLYHRLLREHPDREDLTPATLPRLAIALALAGQAEPARETVARLDQLGLGPAEISWLGRTEPLSDVVNALLDDQRPTRRVDPEFSWPIFGGDATRRRTIAMDVAQLAVLWEVDGIGDVSLVSDEDRTSSFRRALDNGRYLAMNPVVHAGVVYIQDGRRAWAIQLQSGKQNWLYSGFPEPTPDYYSSETELPRWQAPTVDNGRVYARLGREVVSYYGYEPPETTSVLVCLEADTGRLLWRTDRTALGEEPSEMDFESAPIVHGDKVYVVVRRRRPFGFEDCFLCRLNAADGSVEALTHLGSASTGGFGYRRSTATIPALADDSVYVLSNLGTISAVDRHTGRVRWLRLYSRLSEAAWRSDGRGATFGMRPWDISPVICEGARLYALPADATGLLVMDCETGDVLREVPIEKLGQMTSLVGADRGRVYGVGDRAVCYDVTADSLVWEQSLPRKDPADETLAADRAVLGRAALTAAHLLVPADDGLCIFDREDGQVAVQDWDLPGGGNLLALPSHLLVAGADRLTVFARKHEVLARLRGRMDAAPDDSAPALDLAELLYRAGDRGEALDVLDEAIARAGGFVQPIDPALKRRIFQDCLLFASSWSESDDAGFEAADGLYRRASQCAPDTAAHLSYRLEWADLSERHGRIEEAVGLYQQLIADRGLREAPYPADAPRPTPAGRYAEEQITRLIEEHGRAVYARFDEEAARQLTTAETAGSLDRLEQLLATYPNSTAAPAALEAQARVLLSQGDGAGAARALTIALTRYRDLVDAQSAMRRIADYYVTAGQPEHAWRWLTKAARQFPDATIHHDGRQLTFRQYRQRLGEVEARVAPSRPRLEPPLTKGPVLHFEQACRVLDPLFANTPGGNWDTVVVFTGETLRAFDPVTLHARWDEPARCPHPVELLLALPDRLVFASGHRVLALDPGSGRRLWQFGSRPPELDDPATDPEDFPVFAAFARTGNALVVLRDDGQATALQLETGQPAWQQELPYPPLGQIAVDSSRVVYATSRYGHPLYGVLDLATGNEVGLIEPEDDRRAERLLLTLEGYAVVITPETVGCFVPESGRRLWQVQRERDVRSASVCLDVDGLYLSHDRARLDKLRLNDGRVIWKSETPSTGDRDRGENLTTEIFDGQIVLSSWRTVFVIETDSGRIGWEGTVPRGVQYRQRFVTRTHVLAVNSPPERFEEPHEALFYDLAGGSGLIPADGGLVTLDFFADPKHLTVRDGALIVQDGRTLHAWIHIP